MPKLSVIEAVREAMREELERDPAVFVIGEDVGKRGGVFLATQGFLDSFGSDRIRPAADNTHKLCPPSFNTAPH